MKTQFPTSLLTFKVSRETSGFFTTLLQSGMLITTRYGITIREFLMALPGFTEGYINERVQTIFVNGTATDNIDSVLPGPTATLAITTAMPGLAGAIFRKDSQHATLRTTTAGPPIDTATKETIVTLKLFNALAKERGPELLEQGAFVKSYDLLSFLNYRPSLIEKTEKCTIDDRDIPPEGLTEEITKHPITYLKVHC